MKAIRYAAWAAIVLLLLTAGTVYLTGKGVSEGQFKPQLNIGGSFTLTTDEGKRLSDTDLKGKPFAMFFGFTYCPDVCPTTLLEMTQTIEAMGKDAEKMGFFFVSVDPERDTPDLLKTYLTSFDPHITGLTGTPEEISAITKAYRVYHEKVGKGEDYTINHSALIYLMDAEGRFVDVIAYGADADMRLEKIKKLLDKDKA